MTRIGAMLLVAWTLIAHPMSGWTQSRPAEEQPLQEEKIFQELLCDYHLLARLLIHQNRAVEGIPILKNVYELSFKPPVLAVELCDVLNKSGLHAETIEILREQMVREPLNEDWTRRLMAACENARRWDETVKLRADWRKKHPTDLENMANLAEAYRQLQKDAEADELVDKIAITARDKLFVFEKPPSPVRDPHQDKADADGFTALKLQRQLDLQDDFDQYAAAFLLRQRKPEYFDTVLAWLQEKPPTAYAKSVFPDQKAMGLWLAGRRPEAVALLESKFPPRQFPGADQLLFRYYNQAGKPEKIVQRFGKELPDYLKKAEKSPAPAASAPPAPAPTTDPNENPDGEVGETQAPESP